MVPKCYARYMSGEIFWEGEREKFDQLAGHLVKWDRCIVEVVAIKDVDEAESEKVDLICGFKPEPWSDTMGFFMIATLLTRLEMESCDELLGICQPFDLGFRSGEQVLLPQGRILDTIGDHIVLWPRHEE